MLTGATGGSFGVPANDSPALDAVEFCRVLSGRTQIDGVSSNVVPF